MSVGSSAVVNACPFTENRAEGVSERASRKPGGVGEPVAPPACGVHRQASTSAVGETAAAARSHPTAPCVLFARQAGSGLWSFASRVLSSNGTIFETNDTAISLVFAWGGRLHYVLPLPLSTFSPSVFECQPHPASLETWCRDNPEDCPEQCEPELNGMMLAAESGGDVVATSWPRPCQVSEARAAITNSLESAACADPCMRAVCGIALASRAGGRVWQWHLSRGAERLPVHRLLPQRPRLQHPWHPHAAAVRSRHLQPRVGPVQRVRVH